MPPLSTSQFAAPPPASRWARRDWVAALGLFSSTAAVVWWQNAHLAVLWDLSYVLDTSARIALGQAPYRDVPLVHAPLTFLIQAAIIRLTGRVYFHHVLYCAATGGLGTVLAWRILLDSLHGRMAAAWIVSLLLAAPLAVLGLYCILPHPSYDCDCIFSVLCAILLLQRVIPDSAYGSSPNSARALARAFAAGGAVCLPLFFKQNIGLLFLLATMGSILLLVAAGLSRRPPSRPAGPGVPALLALLAGSATALLVAGLLLHLTVGLDRYIRWTIGFAAQRRLPGLEEMLGVYRQSSLMWMLPCVAAGVMLASGRRAKRRWAQALALGLMAAPFLWTLLTLFVCDDADERGDSLLALWPLLLVLSVALTLFRLRRGPRLRALLPFIVLAAIHGALLSQQLWGSTYALWPLLMLLVAEMIAFLASLDPAGGRPTGLAPAMAVVIGATFLACGGLYTASEERLSYALFPEGPVFHATFPQLKGMSTPGPYLPEFEELLRFAAANIPAGDGLILLPGEDPFYFGTGRAPQFPVLLFDPATDPYSSAELATEARARQIRWLVVKRDLEIKADPMPEREAALNALLGAGFRLTQRLEGYDIYRRPWSE